MEGSQTLVMKRLRVLSVLLLLFACGCFQVKDELTLNADGSGTIRIESRTGLSPEILGSLGMMSRRGGGSGTAIYPPMSVIEAKKFFPAKDFTVTAKEKAEEGGTFVTIEATFKDINAMLTSPYGKAHSLTLKKDKGGFSLKGLTGAEAIARMAEIKDDSGMFGAALPGAADLQKKAGEMRVEFRVTLPNDATRANGARNGKTVTWLFERAKSKDAADFSAKVGAPVEAVCAADNVKMLPDNPPRLGLLPFNQLEGGAISNKSAAPDAKKIASAVRFLPYGLHVTRSLDLSGDGGMRGNEAKLIGAVILPQELAPQKWGEVNIEEVVDSKGANLKLNPSPNNSGWSRSVQVGMAGAEEDQDQDSEEPPKNGTEQRRTVTLTFRPPDWKIKEIARIKAAMSLQYFGTAHLVKLSNAVPASWIVDPTKQSNFGGLDASQKPLSDPKLAQLGLALHFQMGMAQAGWTMLMLQVSGSKAALADAQVFDAEGRPWPTMMEQSEMGQDGACQLVVAGQPKGPLSLALLASGVGTTVDVPILLEHVPLTGK